MKRGHAQFGSTTALVALAVVVSLGSVTDVQAGAALAQFLSRLGEAVRLLQDRGPLNHAAALPADASTYQDLLNLAATRPPVSDDDTPPRAVLLSHLIDLPPPASMR